MALAYYNEIDPFAAQWLRNLIDRGLIAPGDVDERSIEDVRPSDLAGYTQCHFFAGIGGWSYALRLAGWPDDRAVWTGSCPCQPFSAAGKSGGFADERHLWPAWFHLISIVHPSVIFGEQVERAINWGWLDLIQDDLESEDYALGACPLPACSSGAPHIRPRILFAAHTNREGLSTWVRQSRISGKTETPSAWREFERVHAANDWRKWDAQSEIRVFADGIPNRVGRLRGYGNAIVPQVAEQFIRAYCEAREEGR